MYGMVLMAALTTADVTPDFGHRCGCCGGCWGCYGGYGGCCGCWGGGGCYGGCGGCYGGGYGCWGGYSAWWGGCGGGCGGCYGGCMGCYGGCMGCYGGCMGCYGGVGMGGYGGMYDGYGMGVGGAGVGGVMGGTVVPGTTTTPNTTTPSDTEPLGKPKDTTPDKGVFVPTKAQLVVDLPSDARLYIDDLAMKTPSGKRAFNTPKLQPGQTYYYILRAEVERDGKTVTKSQRVLVRAGEVIRASFKDLEAPQSVVQASAR